MELPIIGWAEVKRRPPRKLALCVGTRDSLAVANIRIGGQGAAQVLAIVKKGASYPPYDCMRNLARTSRSFHMQLCDATVSSLPDAVKSGYRQIA